MPLHLLGKKSWNVYNADNIARVRKDEALAREKEAEQEQRQREHDAERRLAILRGEMPPPDLPSIEPSETELLEDRAPSGRKERKVRRRYGESDTDLEMRIAQESANQSRTSDPAKTQSSSAPLVDSTGHFDLFGIDSRKQDPARKDSTRRTQATREEDHSAPRFADVQKKDPWYTGNGVGKGRFEYEPASRDVWGNEDPRRKVREAQRLAASDPLAMMRNGATKVRELKKARQEAERERAMELESLKRQNREERHRRREEKRRHREGDSHDRKYEESRRHYTKESRKETEARRDRSRDRRRRRSDEERSRSDRRRSSRSASPRSHSRRKD